MIYYLLKPLAQTWFKIFYRKIFFTNVHTLPMDRPLIFAVNHPTAFLDPVLMGSYLPHTVHFMLRGDVFTNRFFRWLLAQLKTIPIFRARDGFQNLKNNQATLHRVYEILSEKKHIVILAEGLCKHEKRMRPIQKGTARMAFGTYEKYGTRDIAIVPVGVNFTDSNRFRSEIMVDIGPLIELKDYLEDYDNHPRKAINKLTKELSLRMKARIVHIDDPADDEFVEQLLILNRNFKQESILPVIARGHTWLWEEISIAENINRMPEEEKVSLRRAIQGYFQKLKALRISDVSVAKPRYYNWVNTLTLILGFIPFLVGFLLNYWPIGLGRRVADTVVKKIQFHASVRFAIGMVSYVLYYTSMVLVALIVGQLWLILLIALMPVLGFAALQYRDLYQKWRDARRFRMLDKRIRTELLEVRTAITTRVHIPFPKARKAV